MMKRGFTLFLLLSWVSLLVQAKPVDLKTAQQVGAKFLNANTLLKSDDASALQWVSTYRTENGTSAFYVFNHSQGFVVVAADDCALPILGYSDKGPFRPEDHPVQMEVYLQRFVEQIQYGIENHLEADAETARQWALVKATGRLHEDKETVVVEPLIKAAWGQGCYYNDLCPADTAGICEHALVGCVAVAMGQIMHYWGYPNQGNGSHYYFPFPLGGQSNYPMQYANFGETTYDWFNMPNELSESSTPEQVEAVATMLWHCGVSVEMMYGVSASGAYSEDVPDALKTYFKYALDMHFIYHSTYDTSEGWIKQIKASLNMGRPVYYSAADSQGYGGHAFVCDGYDANNMLHFNWGWYGNHDNYFADGALNVSVYHFNVDVAAITNIHPESTGETYRVDVLSDPTYGGVVTGAGIYDANELCTVAAAPHEGYVFDSWLKDGVVVSTNTSLTFSVQENTTMTAHFVASDNNHVEASYYPDADNFQSAAVAVSWNLLANNARSSTDVLFNVYRTHADNNGPYTDANTVLLAENLTTGPYVDFDWGNLEAGTYKFGVSLTGTGGGASDAVWSNPLVKGPGYTITAMANAGQGGTVTGGGYFASGAQCTLTATPKEHYEFVNWTKNGIAVSDNAIYSFAVSEDAEYQAHFVLKSFTISISTDPVGAGDVTAGGSFVCGSVCTLNGITNDGYNFLYWTVNGERISSTMYYYFIVTEDAVCVAHFEELEVYTITVAADPVEGGVVSGGGSFFSNQYCWLSATPYMGYNFVHWTKNGEVIPNGLSFGFVVTENADYVAHFELKKYQVTVNANPSEGGVVSGEGIYEHGTTATVSVVPNENYHFLYWTYDGLQVATTLSYSFVVTGNRQLTAYLEDIEAVNEQGTATVMLYPNPANDKLTIECEEQIRQCEVYSLAGDKVLQTKEGFVKPLDLDVKALPAGVYLLRLTTDRSVLTRRFVKQ